MALPLSNSRSQAANATKVPELRKGDTVLVMTGKDAGKRGTIDRVVRPDQVVVEGLNVAKRHTKPRPRSNQSDRVPQMQQGGIIDRPMPLRMSNVMLVCPRCDRPTRVGHSVLENGRSVRVCRRCGEPLEVTA